MKRWQKRQKGTHTHSNRCRRQNRQGNRAFNFQTITVRPKKKLRGETLLSLDWRGVDRNANATPKWVWTRDEFRVHTICMHETNELTKRRLSQCVWHNEHNEIPEFNSQVRWLLPRESGKICERCLNECPNHYFNCSDQESPQSNRTRSQTRHTQDNKLAFRALGNSARVPRTCVYVTALITELRLIYLHVPLKRR